MTPAERLQAAIAKLEEALAVGWPCREWSYGAARHIARNVDVGFCGCENDHPTWDRYDSGHAIHMLSLTIEPQIEILRDTLNAYRNPIPLFAGHEDRIFYAQLQLADAILGS